MTFQRTFPAILLCLVFCAATGHGQTGSISGTVVDEAGNLLPGAHIRIIGTKIGMLTGEYGTFLLENLEPGAYTLEAVLIGHATTRVENVRVRAGEREKIRIELSTREIRLGAVDVVRDALRQAQDDPRVSVQRMDPREAKYLPGAAEDVLRSLQALPGVLAPNDFSSQLIVRGSGPDQNLVVMDEVEVFNPYRLYGAVSMFNPETVSEISLLTGGFPAKYGNRLSAVLDITNREGRREKVLFGNVNTSLTNANMIFEGRAPDGIPGSWLVSTRRTYYDLILGPFARSAGLVSGDVAFPNFRDLQAKLVAGPFGGHRFVLNGVTSRDAVDVISGANRETPDSVSVLNSTINNIVSAGWYFTPSRTFLTKTILSWYENYGTTEFDGKFLDPVLNREDYSGSQNDSLKALARLFGVSINSSFRVRKYSVKEEAVWDLPGHLLEAGTGFDDVATNISFDLNLSPELKQILLSNPRGSALVENVLQTQRYTQLFLYLQDRIALTDAIHLQPGLRFDRFSHLAASVLSPRLNISYALDPVTTLRAAWGWYYQPPGYEKLFDQTQFLDLRSENLRGLKPERAVHYILGVERWMTSEWLARSELYFKHFDDLIVQKKVPGNAWTVDPIAGADHRAPAGWSAPYRIAADSATTTPVNGSYGEAYGMEMTFEKRNLEKGGKLSGWVSYALAWAQRYRDGAVIPFNYDQRHTVNLVLNFKLLDWLDAGAFWRIGSNFPYTEPRGVKPRIIVKDGGATIATDLSGNVILDIDWGDESRINQSRKPLYHRLDLRFTANTDFWGIQWGFYLDVINAYNHANVSNYRYYVGKNGELERTPVNMFPILPTLGISARF